MIELPTIPNSLAGLLSREYQDKLWNRKLHLIRLFGTDDVEKIAEMKARRKRTIIQCDRKHYQKTRDADIIQVQFDGKKLKDVSSQLGINPSTLYRKRKKLGLLKIV